MFEVLNGADEDGYVILYGSKIQRIELESNTYAAVFGKVLRLIL